MKKLTLAVLPGFLSLFLVAGALADTTGVLITEVQVNGQELIVSGHHLCETRNKKTETIVTLGIDGAVEELRITDCIARGSRDRPMDRMTVRVDRAVLSTGSHLLVVDNSGQRKGRKDSAINLEVASKFVDEFEFTVGIRGETGPRGPRGDVGVMGLQGPQGPQGAVGAVGPQGVPGPQGPQGEVGAIGPQGMRGTVGATGPQGPKGEVGVSGESGTPGPQGPQGERGATGPQGEAGSQGEPGAIGSPGMSGPPGPKGDAGAPGPQGPKGDPGPVGPQGPAASLVGARVAQGECLTENWSTSFDSQGWSSCPDSHPVLKGLYRSDGNWLYNIDYARCCALSVVVP